MARPYEGFLKDLRESALFREFITKQIIPNKPEIHRYRPGDDLQKWVKDSYMAEGYEMAIQQFGLDIRSYNGPRDDYKPSDESS